MCHWIQSHLLTGVLHLHPNRYSYFFLKRTSCRTLVRVTLKNTQKFSKKTLFILRERERSGGGHCSKVFIRWDPNGLVRVVYDDFFDFLIESVYVIALDNCREVLHELALQPAQEDLTLKRQRHKIIPFISIQPLISTGPGGGRTYV